MSTYNLALNADPTALTVSLGNVTNLTATVSLQGPQGLTGAAGATGQGVPAGGTINQYLKKASNTDHDTAWDSLDKNDVGLPNVDNTSDANKPVSTATQTALDAKVDKNAAITGATKTKLTYDAKGLITSGADATTADIADSLDRRYVTDAQRTVIQNTSGTNTGDQNIANLVTGPPSATDNAIARFDLTTGKLIQNSSVTISDTGDVSAASLTLTTDLPVTEGGTGASTAGNALSNLGGQPLDATLTSLAAYNTNGLLTQTAADTFTGRTLTGTANQITVTNGDGVAGDPTLTIPASLQAPGDIRATTYLRVGSLTAPSGSINGDIFGGRLYMGTGSGVSERVMDIRNTTTATVAGANIANNFQNTINPAANSSAEFRALTFENYTTPATGITLNVVRAGYFNNRIRHEGTTSAVTGVWAQAVTVDSSSPATVGTISTATAIIPIVAGRPSGTSTISITTAQGIEFQSGRLFAGATVNDLYDIRILNPGVASLANHYGIDIAGFTRASGSSIGIRIAAPSGATNNYALQLSDTTGVAAGGITWASDVNLYRSTANVLKTDDKLLISLDAEIDGALDHDGTTVGFYGVAPATRPTALTAADATPIDATYDAVEQAVLANLRTRVNELETKLQSLGLLS